MDGHFFVLVLNSKTNNMDIHQMKRLFFILAITILFLFTYSVCDDRVERVNIQYNQG